MKFRADEITSVIQREIEQFRSEVTKTEVGALLEVTAASPASTASRAS